MILPSNVERCDACRGQRASTSYRFVPPFPIPMPVRVPCVPCGGSGLVFSWPSIEEEAKRLAKENS